MSVLCILLQCIYSHHHACSIHLVLGKRGLECTGSERSPKVLSAADGRPCRASFLDVLVSHLDPDLIHCHMNKRCIGVTRSEAEHPRATIRFADGTQTSVDIVLGADGIKSAVRGAVSGQDSQKHVAFSDSVCYRGLVPTDELRASGVKTDLTQRPVCFVGKDKVRAYMCDMTAC